MPCAGRLKRWGTSRLSAASTPDSLPSSPRRPILSTSSIPANHAGPESRFRPTLLPTLSRSGLEAFTRMIQSAAALSSLPQSPSLRPIHAPHFAARPANPGLETSGRIGAGQPFNADCLANWGFRVAMAAANRCGARCRRGEVRPEYPSAFFPPPLSLTLPASRRSPTASLPSFSLRHSSTSRALNCPRGPSPAARGAAAAAANSKLGGRKEGKSRSDYQEGASE